MTFFSKGEKLMDILPKSEKLMDIIYYVPTKILSTFNWLTKKINKNKDQNIF
jgi:hypothetical protein